MFKKSHNLVHNTNILNTLLLSCKFVEHYLILEAMVLAKMLSTVRFTSSNTLNVAQ